MHRETAERGKKEKYVGLGVFLLFGICIIQSVCLVLYFAYDVWATYFFLEFNYHNNVNVENRQPLMEIEFEPEFMGVMDALTGVQSTSVEKKPSKDSGKNVVIKL